MSYNINGIAINMQNKTPEKNDKQWTNKYIAYNNYDVHINESLSIRETA